MLNILGNRCGFFFLTSDVTFITSPIFLAPLMILITQLPTNYRPGNHVRMEFDLPLVFGSSGVPNG